MEKETTLKLCKNALIGEKLLKLDKKERQKIVTKLLKETSERKLSEELGIPKATLHDWKTLRQDNKGENIHVSFHAMYRKLSSLKPEDIKEITDWGRIEQIRDACEQLLRKR